MIKLKVGKNYLITNNALPLGVNNIIHPITFMSAFARGENNIYIDSVTTAEAHDNDKLAKTIKDMGILDIIILSYVATSIRKNIYNPEKENRTVLTKDLIRKIQSANPLIKIKVITINKYQKNPIYTLAQKMIEGLCKDKNWLLFHLKDLHIYKEFVGRSQQIPKEMEVIDGEIKKLTNKNEAVYQGSIETQGINNLKLIKDVVINEMGELQITVLPMYIYPAHIMGRYYGIEDIRGCKYLYEALKYHYLGYKFRMAETVMAIDANFYPKVLKMVDPRYENLLRDIGWGGPGYVHLGTRNHCYGEFASIISSAKEYGLEYYFTGLKQYITTANIHDSAGDNVWAWPLVDENNNIVYSATLDRARDYILGHENGIPSQEKEEVSRMSFDELLTYITNKGWTCYQLRGNQLGPESINERGDRGVDCFLEVCKEREPEIYQQIMERRK